MGEIPFPAWDPVFLEIPGVPVDLRYYGLMYVVGFLCGNWILVRLARRGFLPMAEEKVGDLLFYLILGVILGGRLGFSVFYNPAIFQDPLEILKVWKGGLSFHGGLIGVIVAFTLFAWKHNLPILRVGDAMTMAACPGIFFVRMANFINGELWGRKIDPADADSVPWAMRFPTDPAAQQLMRIPQTGDKREGELATLKAIQDGTWDRVKDHVPLRHPSQIYEGLAEGVLLGIVLFLIYRATRLRAVGTGVFMGIFLAGYGVMRFGIEFYRQPDNIPGLILFDWMTRGQQLCALMIAVGVTLLIVRRNKKLPPGAVDPGESTSDAAPA